MINKITRKSLLKSKALIFVIFLLFIVAQTLYVAKESTYPRLQGEVDKFLETTNIEDFRIFTISEVLDMYDDEWAKDIESKYDLSLERNFYYFDQIYNEKFKSNISYDIVKYNPNDKINTLEVLNGSEPLNSGEVFLEQNYADVYNVNVGDEISLGEDKYTVAGTGYSPEYVFPIDLLTSTMGLISSPNVAPTFVPVFMNESDFTTKYNGQEIVYFSGKFNKEVENKKEIYKSIINDYTYNIPLLDETGKPQKDENGAIITESLKLVPIILPVDNNWAITGINQELQGQSTMFSVLSSLIFIISLVIIVILFNNVFTSQKKEIGILKASGVTRQELSVNYTFYLVLILFIASVIGAVSGLLVRTKLTSFLTQTFAFPINNLNQNLLLSVFLLISVTIFIVVVVVYFLSIRRNLAMEPILLLKNINSQKPPKIKMEFLTRNMKFINKYKFNIMFRNLGISILLVFCVFVSSFLLLLGGSIYTSFNKALNMTSTDAYAYDYMVVYSEGTRDPDYDNNSMIIKTSKVQSTTSNAILTKLNSNIKFLAYDFENNEYIKLKDQRNEELNKDAVYITSAAAKIYNLEAGDYLSISSPFDATKEVNFKVGGIVENALDNQIYVDISSFQHLFGLDLDYANAEVGVGDKKAKILDYDADASYALLRDNDTNNSMTQVVLMLVITMIAGIAVFISTVTMIIISSIIISKNKKTISIMKVMGYTNKEINQMIISPYKWILIIVYFASIPLFKWLIQQIVNMALSDLDVSVTIHIPFSSTILGFAAIFIIYLISIIISSLIINRISLAESLKTDE